MCKVLHHQNKVAILLLGNKTASGPMLRKEPCMHTCKTEQILQFNLHTFQPNMDEKLKAEMAQWKADCA